MRRVTVLAACLILLFAFLLPQSALALGVAIGPPTVGIKDALRGGEYRTAVTVFNPSDTQTTYIMEAVGPAATWLSFYYWRTGEPIQSLSIAGRSNTVVMIKANIPSDVINGTYTATIYAKTAPVEITEGASTVMQASSVLTITVTGVQILDGLVGSVRASDTEAGMPVVMDVLFENTGNVVAQPKIDCQITKEDETIEQFSYVDVSVKPGLQETIPIKWETSADKVGDYMAEVTVSIASKTLGTKSVAFKVVPPGTFTRKGALESLALDADPAIGGLAKINAIFHNTGQIVTKAQFHGEVYLDGLLLNTMESDDIEVAVGDTATLASYVPVEKPGEYRIKGYINYEGKTTDVRTLAFKITEDSTVTVPENTPSAPAPDVTPTQAGDNATPAAPTNDTQDDGGSSSTGIIILIVAIAAVVLLGGGFLYKKKLARGKS
ncbi:MAG: hypothetical protein PHV74_07670 [Dehalococcoidia bacterium]|nr:hypothetical protein [Dehalococcoidia bacterium]